MESQNEKPIEEYPWSNMDKKINQMVAKNIKLSEIIIESQRKIRKNSNGYFITIYN